MGFFEVTDLVMNTVGAGVSGVDECGGEEGGGGEKRNASTLIGMTRVGLEHHTLKSAQST